MAEVTDVDPVNQVVKTSVGDVQYDYLVVATGSTNNFFKFESIKSELFPLKTINDALNMRSKMMQQLEKVVTLANDEDRERAVNIAVVGGGPTGVELAGAIVEMKKKVLPKDYPEFDFSRMKISLFEGGDRLLKGMSEESSAATLKYLQKMGVDVKLNARVGEYDDANVILTDGTRFACSTVIWTAGVKAAPIGGFSDDISVGANRLKIDEFNRVVGFKKVFAIGDVAAKPDDNNPTGLPMIAPVAIQHGTHLAKNILREINGKAMIPFEYKDQGVMATVGRNKAVVDLPWLKMQGRIAWFIWMFLHLMALVGFRNRLITFINWSINYFNYDRPLNAIIRPYKKEAQETEPADAYI